MIIKANKEILADVKGYGLSSLDEYINKADEMTRKWIDRNTMKSEQFPSSWMTICVLPIWIIQVVFILRIFPSSLLDRCVRK